jgi:mono/diheme cytochrome c family protein
VGTATYNGIMPSFAHLKDEEVAALLNHLGQSFGNKNPKAFTAEEVKAVRAKKLAPQEVLKARPER